MAHCIFSSNWICPKLRTWVLIFEESAPLTPRPAVIGRDLLENYKYHGSVWDDDLSFRGPTQRLFISRKLTVGVSDLTILYILDDLNLVYDTVWSAFQRSRTDSGEGSAPLYLRGLMDTYTLWTLDDKLRWIENSLCHVWVCLDLSLIEQGLQVLMQSFALRLSRWNPPPCLTVGTPMACSPLCIYLHTHTLHAKCYSIQQWMGAATVCSL